MKNLWKYLSTLGLMFVAFLCLGVGLKANEKAEAKYDVYVDSNATYTISGGTINNGVNVAQNGNFIMNGGTISSYSSSDAAISGYQANITINSGTITASGTALSTYACKIEINGGSISGTSNGISCPSASITMNGGSISGGINMGGGTVTYNGGTIDRIMSANGDNGLQLILKKQPTSTISITRFYGGTTPPSVGSKIAKLDGISTIDLTKLNVTNMPADTQLEVQYVDGAYWVVVAEKPCKVTLKCNIEGGAQFYPDNDSSNKSNTIVVEVKKGGSFNHHQAMVDFTGVVSGRSRYFVTVNTDKFQSDTTNNGGSWYINDLNKSAIYGTSYTINEDTTIIYRVNQVKCTITFTAMSVLGNPAHYSTTSSTTSYNSASAQYSIDVDTNSTIQVYQKKIIVGSTTVYVIFKLGQVYSSASITGVLAIYLPTSTSSQTVKITQDVRVIYQGKANYFLAQGEEGESPPEARRGIEVVAKQEKRTIEPAIYIVPSESEIVVKRREK